MSLNLSAEAKADSFGPVRDVHATDDSIIVLLEGGRVHLTSPGEGILRMRFVQPGPHRPNLDVAVLKHPLRPLERIPPGAVAAEGITVSFHPDGSANLAGRDGPGEMAPLFAIASVASNATGGVTARLRVGATDPFFGMGEQTGPMNRRGRRIVDWNTDTTTHTPSETPLYASFPVFVSRAHDETADRGTWYGVFVDNPSRSRFDFGATAADRVAVEVESGELDMYVLAGPTPRDVVRRYAFLTGTMEMLPPWMLGYQQSRWSYYPDSRVLEVARRFRHVKFPCDVIYLDIEYMDRFRSFTWHPQDFAKPKHLVDELHSMGFKVIPILNSAISVDPEFEPFREARERGYLLHDADGALFEAAMWPGRAAFPDFTQDEVRAWWGDQHRDLLALGVDGIWNDMNEPTVFEAEPAKTFPEELPHTGGGVRRPHLEVHNAYGMLMNMGTRAGLEKFRPHRRTPLMTRAAYAGTQRYAFMWTGDNSSWWEHMPMAIAQVANLGLCGLPFTGPDVGGFSDDCNGELFLRWLQMGVFFPYLRAHTRQGTHDQEPWSFGKEVLEIGRRFAHLRYEMLPHLYSLLARACSDGDPMLRALFYEFPDDARALVADDQFMLGSDILVAPILAPGRSYRAVYLPSGPWFSFFGGTCHDGENVEVIEVPLDHIPVFVRANAILPFGDPMQYVGEKAADRICWHVWPTRGTGSGWLYEDDGETPGRAQAGFCETEVRGHFKSGAVRLTFEPRRGSYTPPPRTFEVVLHGKARRPRRCSLPGVSVRNGCVCASFEDTAEGREITFEW